jgi:hypothetical protein
MVGMGASKQLKLAQVIGVALILVSLLCIPLVALDGRGGYQTWGLWVVGSVFAVGFAIFCCVRFAIWWGQD